MTELTFHGPFHFDEIEYKTGSFKKDKNIQNTPNPNKSGIYIWGFMYYFNKHGLIAPVNFHNSLPFYNEAVMKFIPYYVGKNTSNVFSRIRQHQNVRNVLEKGGEKRFKEDGNKYTRLSHGYMMGFFNDPLFPIKIGNASRAKELISLIETYPNAVTYYNDRLVLEKIYPKLKIVNEEDNHPITAQRIDEIHIPDTLDDLVNYMNNFWFCFAHKENIENLETFETTVFYSLNGKTISKTESFEKADQGITIIDNTATEIFQKVNGVIKPTNNFPGY
jgi:hypothetical protein